jgi:hypothetical protein
MNGFDPFAVFKLLDPFDDETLTTADETMTTADEALLRRVMSGSAEPPSHPDRLKRWLGGGTILAVVVASAAFAVIRKDHPTNALGVACYQSASLRSAVDGLSSTDDPVAACAKPWLDGTFGNGTVPKLSACVNRAGAAAVFPGGEDVCSRLGLADFVSGNRADQQAAVALQDALTSEFAGRCYRQQQALDEASRLLGASGLTGWTVQPGEFPEGSECAAPGLDMQSKTIVVVGARAP